MAPIRLTTLIPLLLLTGFAVHSATADNVSQHFIVTDGCASGECIDEPSSLESEIGRRVLEEGSTHISYNALRRSTAPCGVAGASYYGCADANQEAKLTLDLS
ncbi:uncharacterized protein A4U43_C05F30610 [Asparagus officinalis]|uniref:Uncharacterized protein n=1 Tax=Asparagus officinalis TaxID=4686 RepID=A0A5P1EWB1_ASPOF|nr:uncharacterized protein A4U43_C05F30610 [Asparagus officinalis]